MSYLRKFTNLVRKQGLIEVINVTSDYICVVLNLLQIFLNSIIFVYINGKYAIGNLQGLFILKLVWKKEKLLSMDNVFLVSQEFSKIEVIGKGNVVVRCC